MLQRDLRFGQIGMGVVGVVAWLAKASPPAVARPAAAMIMERVFLRFMVISLVGFVAAKSLSTEWIMSVQI